MKQSFWKRMRSFLARIESFEQDVEILKSKPYIAKQFSIFKRLKFINTYGVILIVIVAILCGWLKLKDWSILKSVVNYGNLLLVGYLLKILLISFYAEQQPQDKNKKIDAKIEKLLKFVTSKNLKKRCQGIVGILFVGGMFSLGAFIPSNLSDFYFLAVTIYTFQLLIQVVEICLLRYIKLLQKIK